MRVLHLCGPLIVLGVIATQVIAHPLDEGRQQVDFSYRDGQLIWTHALWLGPLVAQPFWSAQLDANGDGAVSSDEASAFASRLSSQVDLRLDATRVTPTMTGVNIAPRAAFLSLPIAPQVTITFTAPISAGEHALEYQTMFDAKRVRLSARFPSGNGARVQQARTEDDVFTAQVSIRSDAAHVEASAAPWWAFVLMGAVAIIVFGAGLMWAARRRR